MIVENRSKMCSGPLAGRAILVTGATGHLGRAISKGIARDGGVPVLNGRCEAQVLAFEQELRQGDYTALPFPWDICNEAHTRAGLLRIAECTKSMGLRFSGLVNNAFARLHPNDDISTISLYSRAAGTNLGAVAHLVDCFAALDVIGSRSVVNISSIYGHVSPDPSLYPRDADVNPAHYGATKAGLLQLTRFQAVNLADRGVRVNCVSPGAFPSVAVQEGHPDLVRNLADRTPMKRIGQPEEVYPAIGFLLGDGASFITGTNINIDGGWTAI
jgi:NAD(P)-dependent dehydrogenase (short-subunit alcohol dehydrogenase family)